MGLLLLLVGSLSNGSGVTFVCSEDSLNKPFIRFLTPLQADPPLAYLKTHFSLKTGFAFYNQNQLLQTLNSILIYIWMILAICEN